MVEKRLRVLEIIVPFHNGTCNFAGIDGMAVQGGNNPNLVRLNALKQESFRQHSIILSVQACDNRE